MKVSRILLLAAALLFSLKASAQGIISSTLELLPFESVEMSDFDLKQPEKAPIVFIATVYNDNKERNLRVELTVTGQTYGKIIFATKHLKKMQPNAVAVFNNKQFDKYKVYEENKAFFDAAVASGSLPADAYVYELAVYDEDQDSLASENQAESFVENIITRPELMYPGTDFEEAPEPLLQKNPFFQWYARSNSFDIAIYPVFDGQVNPEEVVLNRPVYKQTDLKAAAFFYPASAEVLQEGKVYAWQVTAYQVTASGREPLASNVYWFRVSSASQTDQAVTTLELSEKHVDLPKNGTHDFTVKALNQEGKEVNVKPVWRVMPSNMGRIDENGRFTAGPITGTAAVIAQYGNVQEYITVKIGHR